MKGVQLLVLGVLVTVPAIAQSLGTSSARTQALGTGPARAEAPGTAPLIAPSNPSPSNNVTVEIARVGTRWNAGAFVEVDVTVTCRSGRSVLEAFVYVVQNGGNSRSAPIPVVCRGFPRTYIVQVPAGGAPINRGDTSASAYVLLQVPNSTATEAGDDSRPLKIR